MTSHREIARPGLAGYMKHTAGHAAAGIPVLYILGNNLVNSPVNSASRLIRHHPWRTNRLIILIGKIPACLNGGPGDFSPRGHPITGDVVTEQRLP